MKKDAFDNKVASHFLAVVSFSGKETRVNPKSGKEFTVIQVETGQGAYEFAFFGFKQEKLPPMNEGDILQIRGSVVASWSEKTHKGYQYYNPRLYPDEVMVTDICDQERSVKMWCEGEVNTISSPFDYDGKKSIRIIVADGDNKHRFELYGADLEAIAEQNIRADDKVKIEADVKAEWIKKQAGGEFYKPKFINAVIVSHNDFKVPKSEGGDEPDPDNAFGDMEDIPF